MNTERFRITRKLKIAHRFWAGICLFSLPLGVLFYFNMDQLSAKIDFARLELAGNRFQKPAIQLIKALGDFEAASILRSPNEVDAAKQEVDRLIADLETANNDFGSRLGFTSRELKEAGLENLGISRIKGKWQVLEKASRENAKAASVQYDGLVSDLRGWVSHAGDTSNLTLDPEMDTYYLADVTSVTTAQTLNRIGSAMISYEPALTDTHLPAAVRIAMAISSATLKESDFDRITGDLDTAEKENSRASRGASPTLKGDIEPAVAQYKTDVQALIDLLSASGAGKTVTFAEFNQTASRAGKSSLDLWAKTLVELESVLQMRIDGFARYRLILILGTFLSLGIALVVLFFTVRGVTIPLSVTVTHVEHVARGDLSRDLPPDYLARPDEIGTLARAMQGMSAKLREMIREILRGR